MTVAWQRCDIAIACDLRIAAEDAQIGLTEARLGVIPGAGGTQRLPRLIGAARALEMILTGEPLDEHAQRLAALLASRSPSGAQTAKRLVYRGLEVALAQGLAQEREALKQILASADYAEGLAAFAEKRQPRFREGTPT